MTIPIPVDDQQRPVSCPHDQGKEMRWRTQSNHVRVIAYQCLTCGRMLNHVRKASIPVTEWTMIDEWDKDLERNYQTASNAAWSHYNGTWRERQDAEQRARRERYADYLRSPEWQYRRSLRLNIDHHQCQAKLNYCTGRATEVHHLTYEHVGNEPLFDLASVCSSCHRQISEKEGRLRDDDAA